MSTSFLYQGSLSDSGQPANGLYDLRFALFESVADTAPLAGPLTHPAINLRNGLFGVTLDFGSVPFDGRALWLEVAVRTSGSAGGFTPLTPRQPIRATPYALHALTADAARRAALLTGTITASQLTGTIDSSHIAPGTINATMLAPGSVENTALAEGAVTANKLFTLTGAGAPLTLANPNPFDFAFYGRAVAAVGSEHVLVGVNNGSVAYLFDLAGNRLTTFRDPVPVAGSFFGSIVAGTDSGNALISDVGNSTGAPNAGAAHLFDRAGNLLATFLNPTPETNENFGFALAGVGTGLVLIGSPNDSTVALASGAAYLFRTNGTLLTTLTNPMPSAIDTFGAAVAAVGPGRVLIGAYQKDLGAMDAGAAYLFSTNGALLTTFRNPTPQPGENFGWAVAALGTDYALISAYRDNAGARSAGAAYLFNLAGDLVTTFTNPTPAQSDLFGQSVAAVGTDKVLIGAAGDDTGANDSGAAYLFDTNGVLLATFLHPAPAGRENFGFAIAGVDAEKVLIGAPQDSAAGINRGAAYLFTFDNYTPGLVADRVRAGGITTASLAEETVTASKLAPGAIRSVHLTGLYSNAVTFNNASNRFTGDGAGLTGLNASELDQGTVPDSRLSVNVARRNASQTFIGANIFNSAANVFRGNGAALTDLNATNLSSGTIPDARLSTNVALLSSGPIFSGDVAGERLKIGMSQGLSGTWATIAGGAMNTNQALLATVGGGDRNKIQLSASYSTIAGGILNTIQPNATRATIAGGNNNSIGDGAHRSTIGGGDGNSIEQNGTDSIIGGGSFNSVQNGADYAAVGGGNGNTAAGQYSTVAGGFSNDATTFHSTVGGGQNNVASGGSSTVAGGANNVASAGSSFIGGGFNNWVSGIGAMLVGGVSNTNQADSATIGGGSQNLIRPVAEFSTIAGGDRNTIENDAHRSTIGGGIFNTIRANADYGTIAGGNQNAIQSEAWYGSIGGGQRNAILNGANYATIGGGQNNEILGEGHYATIAGGFSARASSHGQWAYASGSFINPGEAQTSLYILRGSTVFESGTELFLDNNNRRITIPQGATWAFEVMLVARSSTGLSAGYRAEGVVENVGGTTTAVGPITIGNIREDEPTWFGIQPLVDDDADALIIRVSGSNTRIIRWVAVVRTIEVVSP